jgi:hypothetical protein
MTAAEVVSDPTAAYVAEIVARAQALNAEQRDRLAVLLRRAER